jgi:thioredoxin reductase
VICAYNSPLSFIIFVRSYCNQAKSTFKNYQMVYDVIVVGGASAGLSAALVLGRMNKQALVFDTGQPRNRYSEHAHNLFTRDGAPPLQLLAIGRQQLSVYPSVAIKEHAINRIEQQAGHFALYDDTGAAYQTKKVILATGVTDVLPDIRGVQELWGKKVIHCPFCHGWEVKDQPVALIANGEVLEHMIPMLGALNKDITIVSNGAANVSDTFISQAKAKGIAIHEAKVSQVKDAGEQVQVLLENGQQIAVTAVYMKTQLQFNNQLAVQLGCALSPEGSVQVTENFETTVPGIFAVGDLSHPGMHQVIFAASGGAKAAMMIVRQLLMEAHG